MKKMILWKTFTVAVVVVLGVCLVTPALAESKSEQNAIEINPPRYIDLAGKDVDGIVKFDPGFYNNLHEILEQEYLEDKDLVMIGMLEAMGITNRFQKIEKTKGGLKF
ncbi:MAG: hypothetical protein WBM69_04755 [Desulfobacterales bacterium]